MWDNLMAARAVSKEEDLIEELSELEHEQWCDWAKNILEIEDISKKIEERWKKYNFKPYKELSVEQKYMSIKWARKVLKIVKKHMEIK
jgi:hypothetical protein